MPTEHGIVLRGLQLPRHISKFSPDSGGLRLFGLSAQHSAGDGAVNIKALNRHCLETMVPIDRSYFFAH